MKAQSARGSNSSSYRKLMSTIGSPNPLRKLAKVAKKSAPKGGTGRGHAGPGVAANRPKKRSR
jgi:hypothetical protein